MNNALCMDNWTVSRVEKSDALLEITGSYDIHPTSCTKCGVVGRLYRHGVLQSDYCDVARGPRQVVIHAEVQRYRCQDCKATFNQELPDMDDRRMMTRECINHIAAMGTPRTFTALANEIGVDEKTIRNICNEELHGDDPALSIPTWLGIDEIYIPRHRKRGVFVDCGRKRLIDMTSTMGKERLKEWIVRNLTRNERGCVQIVTIDMTETYRDVAAANFPNAKIVVDKFHVIKRIGQAYEQARLRSKPDQTKRRHGPRANIYLLRKNRENITDPMDEMLLNADLERNPLLKAAHQAREAFADIYRKAKGCEEAERMFDTWREKHATSIPEFEDAAATVQAWRKEIFHFFDYPFTNAYTEYRNKLIRALNRAGNGYTFPVLRAKAMRMRNLEGDFTMCEMCLGQFESDEVETVIYPVPGRTSVGVSNKCPACRELEPFHKSGHANGHGIPTSVSE